MFHHHLCSTRSQFVKCVVACLAATIIAAFGVANESLAQSLQWKLAKGDQFSMEVTQNSAIETKADRQASNQSSEMTLEIDWEVESVDENQIATINQKITAVKVSLTMPGSLGPQTITYNSKDEKHESAARRMKQSFSKIIDQTVQIKLTPQGEITNVIIPDETMESLRTMPASMQGRKMFEKQALTELFAHAGMNLPEEELAQGDSWNVDRDFTIGTPQSFIQSSVFTLESVDGDVQNLKIEGAVKLDDASDNQQDRDSKIEFEAIEVVESKLAGTITFNTAKGHCESSESTLQLKTRTDYRDIQVTSEINSSVKLTIERK